MVQKGSELEKTLVKFQLAGIFKLAQQEMDAGHYEHAAALFLELVKKNPEHEFADKALNNAAVCYENTRRFDSALRTYERIINEYPKSTLADQAVFRVASDAEQSYDFDKAVSRYLLLVDHYPNSKNRAGALYNAARLLEGLQRYPEAAAAYKRYAEVFPDEPDAPQNLFRAALINEKRKDYEGEIKAFQEFDKKFDKIRGQAELTVQARLKMAQAYGALNRDRERLSLLKDTVATYDRLHLGPDKPLAADAAAEAQFDLLEEQFQAYDKQKIFGSKKVLEKSFKDKTANAKKLRDEYAQLLRFKRPEWVLAGFYRRANVLEHFANSIYDAPIPPEVKRLGDEAIGIYQDALGQKATALESQAVDDYVKTLDEARKLHIVNAWTKKTLESLNHYRPKDYPLLKDAKERLALEVRSPEPLAGPDGPREAPIAAPAPGGAGSPAPSASESSAPRPTAPRRQAQRKGLGRQQMTVAPSSKTAVLLLVLAACAHAASKPEEGTSVAGQASAGDVPQPQLPTEPRRDPEAEAASPAARAPAEPADQSFKAMRLYRDGVALAEGGNCNQASGHFEEALRRDPTFAWAAYDLGICQERVGMPGKAKEAYRRALVARPNFAEAGENLLRLELRLGESRRSRGRAARAPGAAGRRERHCTPSWPRCSRRSSASTPPPPKQRLCSRPTSATSPRCWCWPASTTTRSAWSSRGWSRRMPARSILRMRGCTTSSVPWISRTRIATWPSRISRKPPHCARTFPRRKTTWARCWYRPRTIRRRSSTSRWPPATMPGFGGTAPQSRERLAAATSSTTRPRPSTRRCCSSIRAQVRRLLQSGRPVPRRRANRGGADGPLPSVDRLLRPVSQRRRKGSAPRRVRQGCGEGHRPGEAPPGGRGQEPAPQGERRQEEGHRSRERAAAEPVAGLEACRGGSDTELDRRATGLWRAARLQSLGLRPGMGQSSWTRPHLPAPRRATSCRGENDRSRRNSCLFAAA